MRIQREIDLIKSKIAIMQTELEILEGYHQKSIQNDHGVISKEQALEALDEMDDYARMPAGINPIGARETLLAFIEQWYNCKDDV